MGTTCNDKNKASGVNLDSTKEYPKNKPQFSSSEVEEVLSDFKKLNFNFKDNKCEDPSDSINYNNSWPADPFDK